MVSSWVWDAELAVLTPTQNPLQQQTSVPGLGQPGFHGQTGSRPLTVDSVPDLDQGQRLRFGFLSFLSCTLIPSWSPIILIIQKTPTQATGADGNIDLPFSRSFRSLETARDMTELPGA